jgi:shikimate dehydrogenase
MSTPKHFGLIGHPISHSQSPALFYQYHPGTQDTYDLIETPDFDEAISIFRDRYDAINITAPFKERGFLVADTLERSCELCGATNLLKKEENQIKGYNTDIDGVYRTIASHCGEAQYGRSALIIGCGGAGKAAAIAMAKLGCRVTIANRNIRKGELFSERLISIGGFDNIDAISLDRAVAIADLYDFIIYTLPVAIEGLSRINFSDKVVLEANYRDPQITPAIIKETTLYLSGKEWLLHQAQAAWDIFYTTSY